MSIIKAFTSVALAAIMGFGFTAGANTAGDVERFYRGKRPKIIIGASPDGGYETNIRPPAG